MKNVTAVMLLGLVLGFSTSVLASSHKQGENMMSDSAKQHSQGMMMSDEDMDEMHKNMMGMSEEEREQYKMKLQDCEKAGRSAKECEAKLERYMDRDKDKMMDQDKMMKQDKDQKHRTY